MGLLHRDTVQRGTFILSLSPFPFYFFSTLPSFLRLFSSLALLFLLLFRGGLFTGFCFLSVLPLFLLLFFRLVAPLSRFAMGNSLLLSLSLCRESCAVGDV